MAEPLIGYLTEASSRLSSQLIARMYEDPFWQERFGERGHGHALEDAAYHVRYLIQTLDAGDQGIFDRYAVWLRTVLASRGMCSRHLDDSFKKLADALRRENPDADLALSVLQEGRRALAYAAGPSRELEAKCSALTTAMAREVDESHLPSETARAPYLLSYLADALDANAPAWFARHVDWLAGFLERHGHAGDEILARQLDALERHLSDPHHASSALFEAARPVIAAARTRVSILDREGVPT